MFCPILNRKSINIDFDDKKYKAVKFRYDFLSIFVLIFHKKLLNNMRNEANYFDSYFYL